MRPARTPDFATTLRGEILALALLLFLLTATLAFVTLPTPGGRTFAVDQPQTMIAFRDFYPVERNQATTFRWSKPAAALLVRPEAPGDYRLILTVQSPPGAPPRALVVAVGDTILGSIQPESVARDHTLPLTIAPQQWIATVGHETTVDLRVSPYAPPGDSRALGVAVTRVALLPERPAPALFALAWGGALLLTATAYAALRSVAATARSALLALGGLIATYGLLTLLSRDAALVLALLPVARPALVIGVGLGCLLLIPISRLWQWSQRGLDTASRIRAPRATLAQHARVELVLLLLLLLAFGTFRQDPGWNEDSRADLAVALVDERTTRIDRLAGNTEDKAF